MATLGTQDEVKQNIRHKTICVGYHHAKDEDKQSKGTICVGNNTVEVCLYFLS
jgi:hypothetical protein